MINSYRQQYLCEPIYSMTGQLKAMEMLTVFTDNNGNIVSYNDVTDILTPEYKWLNFVRQVNCVHHWQVWFFRHHICISLNLDADTARWLVRDRDVLALLAKMPFIRLEIHEHFPASDNDNYGLLSHLRRHVSIWLDDVGSGSQNNFELLIRGYFCAAKIDKHFFWQNHVTDPLWLGKVIRDLKRYAGQVVVEGIEGEEHLVSLASNPHCWIQGYLFKRTPAEYICNIPLNIRNSCITTM